MVSVALAAIGVLQLLLVFVIEQSTVLRRLTKRVFLQAKDDFPDIKGLFGDTDGTVAEDVLRVTDLIFGLLGSALNLVVGAAIAIAIGVIGSETRQRPSWMVIGAYVAGVICLAFLIVLLVMIMDRQVQDHARWKRTPSNRVKRSIRNALSLRTPCSYKLIVLLTSAYLLAISSQYTDSPHVMH